MNNNSYICNFIKEHPEDWETRLRDRKVSVRYDGCYPNLAVMYYDLVQGPDFTDPVVQEARGIIIDTDTLEVVCWPFRKFGNWAESYADEIDWNSARVMDKIDGSLCKLYYYNNEWIWATSRTIRAATASIGTGNRNFMNVIQSAVNYKDIPHNLDQDCTYLFELVSPETRIVISYPFTKLYHIGTRNNKTGKELECDIGIEKPKTFSGKASLEYWKCEAEKRNVSKGDPTAEGYVVVDKNYHRVKIKTPEYVTVHRLAANWNLTKERAMEIIKENDPEKISVINKNPRCKAIIAYYKWRDAELEYKIETYLSYVRGLYEEYEHDKKAVAVVISNDPFSYFGFAGIGNEKTAMDLLKYVWEYRKALYMKLIPDYEEVSHK